MDKGREVIDRIVEAAMRVFARYGYFRAPVHLIAEEAGVSKGLVFWYFRTKEELVTEVAKRALPTDVISRCIDEGLNGQELLICIGTNYLNKYRDDEYRMLFINTLALANVNEIVREELSKICSDLLDRVAEKAYGILNMENVVKARIFFGGLMCYILNPPKNIAGEDYLKSLINIIYP